MGSGAADHGQASADPPMDPAVPEHPREPRARLLPQRQGLQEAATLPIPDELVAEVFLRLPTPADLVRASAACVSFRSLVAGRSFLRRFRKLHPPPLLGFLGDRVFHPVMPPHPSASAANAVALAADFSFSFLPARCRDWLPGPGGNWKVRDVRGGRVLLSRRGPFDDLSLVVCDPLHRLYLLLPPIPEVAGWVPRSLNNQQSFLKEEEEEAAEGTSFTVILIAKCGDKHAAFIFSSSTEQWRAGPWAAGFSLAFFSYLRYAYGCFYGMTECAEKSLVLDTRTMEFSVADLPPEATSEQYVNIAIVEAGEGIIGMFVFPYHTSQLSYLIRRNNGGRSSQWRLEKTIRLDSCWYSFTSSTGRHLLLLRSGSSSQVRQGGIFALDIKTFQLEKVFATPGKPMSYVYNNFPPSLLSSPTISSAAS